MRFKNLILFSAAAVATAVVVRKILADQNKRTTSATRQSMDNHREEEIDMENDDSFPASDPPSWSGGHYH
ncbi:hypothetical protein [Bdellovibrio sp. HCB274]|uniref:hypothetical protein n=1 Tax=Bdellovibrio sp. HCB274 TaxID=3394361 RepID=UPI0039B48A97